MELLANFSVILQPKLKNMNRAEAESRIKFLSEELERHNRLYYQEAKPEISDYDFDMMLKELEQLEKDFPEYASPLSPTKRVGGDITKKFETVKHSVPMLSLDNTYSFEEIAEFDKRVKKELGNNVEYVCELKIDGTAISLVYENGNLKQAVTRGNGFEGDDVTTNIKTIRSIPLKINCGDLPSRFEVRGEVYMPIASFVALNEERHKELEDKGLSPEEIENQLFKNPRNAAAGSLKIQDSSLVAKRKLDAFIYYLIGEDIEVESHEQRLLLAQKWGFRITQHFKKCRNTQEIFDFINYWDEKRFDLDFDIDGIVIKINDTKQQRFLGNTAKSPRWAISYKYKAKQAETILENITYQVGRTGAITPVANLKPVLLAGTTVKRATLHNADFIENLDLRIGDTVFIEKGGEIIPKILGVKLEFRNPMAKKFEFIKNCPECNTPLIRKKGEAAYYCPNETGCKPQIIARIQHFTGRKAMNIEAIGEKTVELFYEKNLVKSIPDLYFLKFEDILKLEGFKELSAQNILNGLENSKNTPFEKVLFALGIRFVGETVAKKLAFAFKNIDNLKNASFDELISVEEIGEKIAESVISYFQNKQNLANIEKLKSIGLKFELDESQMSERTDKLQGKTFVISGVFKKFSRDEIKEMIEKNGGKNTGTVSAKTDFLVAGDNMGPAKLEKAQKLGVNIISENEFLDLIA